MVDNTFYPCSGGSYQSEVDVPDLDLLVLDCECDDWDEFELLVGVEGGYLCGYAVFVVLLQLFIFLFAYIMIMVSRLQNNKKKLKKVIGEREEKEDLEIMHTFKEKERWWINYLVRFVILY